MFGPCGVPQAPGMIRSQGWPKKSALWVTAFIEKRGESRPLGAVFLGELRVVNSRSMRVSQVARQNDARSTQDSSVSAANSNRSSDRTAGSGSCEYGHDDKHLYSWDLLRFGSTVRDWHGVRCHNSIAWRNHRGHRSSPGDSGQGTADRQVGRERSYA